MVDNPTISLDSIKSRMDDLFIFSSQVPYGCKHPLRVVQASKSLIGINIEDPSRQLLKWLDDYVKDFTPNYNPPFPSGQKISLDTITYTHLANLIHHKKKSESKIYLSQLLQVADPTYCRVSDGIKCTANPRELFILLVCFSESAIFR